ncbi:MAG: G5 domain-containing protein, partial [Clostridia bacterium]|nr:G5 domain-containing protein [Clostridia bacterium]
MFTKSKEAKKQARRLAPAALAALTLCLVALLALQVRTVTITLDQESDTFATLSQDPLVIAQNSAFPPEETDLLQGSSPGGRLIDILIHRRFPVTIPADGETVEQMTYGGTVRELLTQADVPVYEGDAADLSFDARLVRAGEITLTRMRRVTEVIETEIPYSVQRVASLSVPEGKMVERQAGQTGLQRTVMENRYLGDTLVESVVLSDERVKEPVTAVVAYVLQRIATRATRKVLEKAQMPNVSIFINIERVLIWFLALLAVLEPVFG